jgi:hypothetical protein
MGAHIYGSVWFAFLVGTQLSQTSVVFYFDLLLLSHSCPPSQGFATWWAYGPMWADESAPLSRGPHRGRHCARGPGPSFLFSDFWG